MPTIHLIAVPLSGVAAMCIGALWYEPILGTQKYSERLWTVRLLRNTAIDLGYWLGVLVLSGCILAFFGFPVLGGNLYGLSA